MTDALLQTKLHIPLLRSSLVPRPRLTDKLDAGMDGRLILVSAPAGSGKTTLIIEWLHQSDHRVTWLSLDESDNDPKHFLDYLLAALWRIQADAGRSVAVMLQSPQPPPPEIILTALVNELSAISQPFILVLDDYHAIHTPPIHGQLNFLLEHQLQQMRMVIITREDPPLPLSRLRARGWSIEIRQADLRFSSDECADFLQRVMELNLSSDDIAALERRTEGWIAGLQLAALSMRGHQDVPGFIQAFTGSSRFILDYLLDEVFERQSPDVKEFLLKTSVLERMCGALCDAVIRDQSLALSRIEGSVISDTDHRSLITRSQTILESLEHSNLFIISLDQSRQWFRYHRLFVELLRQRLQITESMSANNLHRSACQWFTKEGLFCRSDPSRIGRWGLGSRGRTYWQSSNLDVTTRRVGNVAWLVQVPAWGGDSRSSTTLRQLWLVITVRTTKSHVHHILEKLGTDSRMQAVAKARELGLV